MTLECSKGNRRMRKTYPLQDGWSLACPLPLCFTSKVFKVAPPSPVKSQSSRYKMIHIYINRLDKSHIRCININIYQTKIHETHMEEGFSLLSIMKIVQITTQRLRQGLLCKPRTLSSAALRCLEEYHQHKFSLSIMIH